jgi:hypothetical protein
MNTKKISKNQWSYRGGLIEFVGKSHYGDAPKEMNWCWDCCGVYGYTATKKEAKEKIDLLLSQAAAILQREQMS